MVISTSLSAACHTSATLLGRGSNCARPSSRRSGGSTRRRQRHVHHVEVALGAVGDVVLAAARVEHRADQEQVDDRLELARLVEVVHAAVLHELAHDLERDLVAPLVVLGHRDVVDEDDHLLVARRAEGLAPAASRPTPSICALEDGRRRRRREGDLLRRGSAGSCLPRNWSTVDVFAVPGPPTSSTGAPLADARARACTRCAPSRSSARGSTRTARRRRRPAAAPRRDLLAQCTHSPARRRRGTRRPCRALSARRAADLELAAPRRNLSTLRAVLGLEDARDRPDERVDEEALDVTSLVERRAGPPWPPRRAAPRAAS